MPDGRATGNRAAIHPAEHAGQKRPRRDCTAERCWCKWIRFHQSRTNAKLKRGSFGA